jgi:Tfp pilus assembly protein PilF
LAGKAFRQLGFYRLLKKQWAAATPLLRQAVTLDPADTQAWLWLGQGYQNAGNRPKASESYQRVLALDPKNALARNGLKSLEARKSPRPS